MEGSPVDIFIFAPLAPVAGVILFWFIQLLFIESQKYLLQKIRSKHEALCRFTNLLGIIFQTICHALGYTVTKSGISEFYISVNYGRVAPKKEKKGIFEWISNFFLFVGPFFVPAFLLLLCLFFLVNNVFEIVIPKHIIEIKYTFGGQLNIFGANLYNFSVKFFGFLASIDLLHPGHLGFLLFMIFLGLGIRPTYIGEKKVDKIDMIYDLKNIGSLIRDNPLYVIIIFSFAYIIFYISLGFNQNWYIALFSIFGWLSIISIASLFISHLILFLIKTADEIPGFWRIFPYLTIPFSYVIMRTVFYFFPFDLMYATSLFVMVLSTALVTFLLLRFKSDRFKTLRDMKLLKKKVQGDADEQ